MINSTPRIDHELADDDFDPEDFDDNFDDDFEEELEDEYGIETSFPLVPPPI